MTRKPLRKPLLLLGLLIFLPYQDLTTQQVRMSLPAMNFNMAYGMNSHAMPSDSADISGLLDLSFGMTDALYKQLNCSGLNQEAFRYAIMGLQWLDGKGLVNKAKLLVLIDYSLPSTEERMFVIDLSQPAVLCRTLVAHGSNTGSNEAVHFSNKPGSHQSCLGFFTTGSTYTGQNGYSMWLDGLDTTFNEQARSRAIVMHGAGYVSETYIRQYGRIGRSWGCPALPSGMSREIIDLIRDGAVLFGYYPDKNYFESSMIIRAIEEARSLVSTGGAG